MCRDRPGDVLSASGVVVFPCASPTSRPVRNLKGIGPARGEAWGERRGATPTPYPKVCKPNLMEPSSLEMFTIVFFQALPENFFSF